MDDSLSHTGLTSFLGEVGLTALPKQNLRPRKEALDLGSEVVAVADNTLFGWSLSGQEDDLEGMLTLLQRIGTRTTFDALNLRMLSARSAEQLTSLLDPGVQQALSVAVSSALGLKEPKGLYGKPNQVRRLTRGVVTDQWSRLVTPRRGALVVTGGDAAEVWSIAAKLFTPWNVRAIVLFGLESCWDLV